jgi:hypothetical protein
MDCNNMHLAVKLYECKWPTYTWTINCYHTLAQEHKS